MRIPHWSRTAENIVDLRNARVISSKLVFEIGPAEQLFYSVSRASFLKAIYYALKSRDSHLRVRPDRV